jgi:mRNA-degrading endonuclease RelE of RelBE toxin-antitoxin system
MDIAPMPSALSGTLKPCRGGHGDSKPLKGALKGRYRPRVGKWRIFVLVATGR